MINIILQTKRLNISIPTIGSLNNWRKLQSDPDVMKYIADGNIRDKDGAKVSLQKSIKHYEDHGFCFFDIYEKGSGEFIGEAGLIYLAFDQKNKDVEVGYTLHKKYWRLGYATEVAEAFIKWGFKKFHFNKIVACCEPDNIASSNVIKKCGMKYKGKYFYDGKSECDIYCINNEETRDVI